MVNGWRSDITTRVERMLVLTRPPDLGVVRTSQRFQEGIFVICKAMFQVWVLRSGGSSQTTVMNCVFLLRVGRENPPLSFEASWLIL